MARKQIAQLDIRMAKIWTVNGREFTSKAVAYRRCRTMNGKRAGGKRLHNVQRKTI